MPRGDSEKNWARWPEQLARLHHLKPEVAAERMTYQQMADAVNECPGPERSRDGCRMRLRTEAAQAGADTAALVDEAEPLTTIEGIQPRTVIDILRQGPTTLASLADKLDRGRPTVEHILAQMMEMGYAIERTLTRVELPLVPHHPLPPPIIREPQAIVKWGATGDTHFGSNFEQPTSFNAWVDEAYDDGVRHILHAGDIFAGRGVYRGQEHEVYTYTPHGQVEATDVRLPRKKGLTWYMLGGNHDYRFFRLYGIDPLAMLAAKRDDVVTLGYDAADLSIIGPDPKDEASELFPRLDARLWHPAKAQAYALSYHGQKYAEQLAFQELLEVIMGDKPIPTIRWILAGHFHWTGLFMQGPIWLMHTACWESQTGYLKSKGLMPQVAGVIVECEVREGMVIDMHYNCKPYKVIRDDYLNWPIPASSVIPRGDLPTQPLFAYTGD